MENELDKALACHCQLYLFRCRLLFNGTTASVPHIQPDHNAEYVQKAWFGRGKMDTTAEMSIPGLNGSMSRILPGKSVIPGSMVFAWR
jgi:hypothetical protein